MSLFNKVGSSATTALLNSLVAATIGSYSLNTAAQSCTPAAQSLQSWWKGEGNAGDSWGPNPGTLLGSPTFTTGMVGQAFHFNGNDDGVTVSDHSSVDPSEQITVEFWVKASPVQDGMLDGYYVMVDKSHGGPDESGWLFQSGDQLVEANFGAYTSIGLRSVGGYPLDTQWHHVAGVFDGTAGFMRLYIDGNLFQEYSLPPGTTIRQNNRSINLGHWWGGNRYFRGSIDELSIYNRALSNQEVQAIYEARTAGKCPPQSCSAQCVAAPSQMAAWLPAELSVGDRLGGQTVVTSNVSYGGGVAGSAFVFDGVDDRLSIQDSPRVHQVSALSVELWFQGVEAEQDWSASHVTLVDKSHGGGDRTGWAVESSVNSGQLNFLVDGEVSVGADVQTSGNVLDGEWHHFVGVFDGFYLRLYLDGFPEDEAPVFTEIRQNTRPLNIGFWNGGAGGGPGSRFFNGRIDEVTLYNRALSQAEVQSLFAAGGCGKCDPCVGGPQILSVSPSDGDACVSTQVSIEGSGFCNIGQIYFGTEPAESFTVLDSSTISAVAPPSSGFATGCVDVQVDAAVLFDGFCYRSEAPDATSIAPGTGPYTGTLVTIRGVHFCPQAQVRFGSEPAQFVTFVSNTELRAMTPVRLPGGCDTAFTTRVTVINPDGRLDGDLVFVYQPSSVLRVGAQPGDYMGVQAAIDAAVATGLNGFAVVIDPEKGGLFDTDVTEDDINPRGKTIFIGSTDPDGTERPILASTSVSKRNFRIEGSTSNVVLSCLVIRTGGVQVGLGAKAVLHRCEIHDHQNLAQDGGAVLVQGGASATLVESELHTNKAARGGGVAYLGAGTSGSILNCAIVLNEASQGGGVYVGDGVKPILIQGDDNSPGIDPGIRFNIANGHGGGIYLGALPGGSTDPGEHRLCRLEIIGNDASGLGGGVFLSGNSKATIRNSYVGFNNPEVPERTHEGGGGIACNATAARSTLSVSDCILENNRADGQCALGGAILIKSSINVGEAPGFITRNIICGNLAQVGGAIALDTKANARVFRNVIAENAVASCLVEEGGAGGQDDPCLCPWQSQGSSVPPDVFGAGVFERDSKLVLVNNTIHRNTGNQVGSGGGLHGLMGFFEDSTARNNIFSENSGYGMHLVVAAGCSADVSYNDFWMNANGPFFPDNCSELSNQNGNLFLNPMFVDPNDRSKLELLSGSPCIDAGDPGDSVPPGGGAIVDMGAIERITSVVGGLGSGAQGVRK